MSTLLLTPDETAEILQISRRTLERWRSVGMGPPFVRMGQGGKYSVIRYRMEDLNKYLSHKTEIPEHENNTCSQDGNDNGGAVQASKDRPE